VSEKKFTRSNGFCLEGLKFGRLIVMQKCGRNKHGKTIWRCECACGNEKIVTTCNLRTGVVKSCGCLRKDNNQGYKHGGFGTPEYRVWAGMISRCHSVSNDSYHRYGGKGIKVCRRWRNSFVNFLEDMGKRPSLAYSIDRINNAKGYSRQNCRWATSGEQARNRRSSRMLTYKGRMQCATDWAKEYGIDREAFYARLDRGWSLEDSLNIPSQRRT
jgi:hypothetical protein